MRVAKYGLLVYMKACRLANKKKYQDALSVLEGLPEEFRADWEVSLLELKWSFNLEKYDEAPSRAERAYRIVSAATYLNDNTKAYLHAYAGMIKALSLYSVVEREESIPVEQNVSVSDYLATTAWNRIVLRHVKRRTRRRFPLIAHPEWNQFHRTR